MKLMTSAAALMLSVDAMAADCPAILDSTQRKLNSTEMVNLCESFKGKTLLVVNTASQCGFTSQFSGLEALYQMYKADNFAVVGFPSNDFNQDRGDESRSAKVCYLDYGVTFPMLSRSAVKGTNANPVFKEIIKASGVEPKWNFYKYLITPDGKVVATFPSSVAPQSETLLGMIEQHIR
nr:glutathione peroxidase [Enterovibrio coralii]